MKSVGLVVVAFISVSCDRSESMLVSAVCGCESGDAGIDASVDAAPDAAHVWASYPPSSYTDTSPGCLADPTLCHALVAVEFPASYASSPNTPRPLAIFLGGYGSDSGFSAQQGFGYKWLRNVPPLGAIVIAPTGLRRPGQGPHYWNADPSCCDVSHVNPDDVGYLAQLITQVRADWNISRVIVMGRSNGGYMAERLACSRPDVVDVIVDFAGAGRSSTATYACSGAVHALIDHSGADHYDVGTSIYGLPVTATNPVTRAERATLNGCSNYHQVATGIDHDSQVAGGETTKFAYDCTGADLEHWYEPTSIHVFPTTSNGQPLSAPIVAIWGDDAWAWATSRVIN